MMMIASMLILIVGLRLQLPSYVTIHNRCSNTKLVSPVYFSNDAVCPKLFSQQANIGTEMKASFEVNTTRVDFESALLFKLQRYYDNQYSMSTSTTGVDKDEAMHVYMLVAWKVKDSKHFVYVVLVKHNKEFIWNEDNLKKLYYENHDRFKEYSGTISDTWLMDDSMALETTFRVRDLEGSFELSISISEERDDYAIKPFYIDLER
jgi:hypothetical protein